MRPFCRLAISVLMVPLLLAGCQTSPNKTEHQLLPHNTLAGLVECMTGTFSSRAQAQADPENYYEIQLVMVPIWTERDDGRWLYVEQAAAGSLDRPYRQRVYHVTRASGSYRSDVYTLPGDPLAFAGAWAADLPMDRLAPDDLDLRDGCSIILQQLGPEEFAGSTIGDGCASTMRGASYATSEVRITPNVLESWDRGFDAAGNQVWGAELGPYVFVRITE